jgi:SAM-dependent methyltransferase
MSNPWVGDLTATESAERARAYAQRFDRLAARGVDLHGEADLVAELVPIEIGGTAAGPPSVLDAGCGTGRVAGRLAEQGYRTVGVDLDSGMLGRARLRYPALTWVESDLAELTAGAASAVGTAGVRAGHPFDAVVAAGNVMPLLTPGTETTVIAVLAGLLRPGGLLIAGFGMDDAHLPPSAPAAARFRRLPDYDRDCSAAGLMLRERWAGWGREPFDGGGYAVSVHVRK